MIVECVANLGMKRPGRVGASLGAQSVRTSLNSLSFPGDRIIVVIQKARSITDSSTVGAAGAPQAKVRRGDIRHAVIVRTAKKVQRKDGSVINFGDNACALIGKNGEPLGTRIAGEHVCQNFLAVLTNPKVLLVPSFVTSSTLKSSPWPTCTSKCSMEGFRMDCLPSGLSELAPVSLAAILRTSNLYCTGTGCY